MKPLDDFLKKINQYAPGVAIPTAYSAIRDAATDFCERTRLWRYEDEFTVSADEAEAITTPPGSVLLDIERAWFDGNKLTPATVDWLDDRANGWRDGTLTGQPEFLTQLELNTLRVVPAQAGTIKISVWLKPSQDCTDLPDFLSDQYRETIAFGALARLLAIPGQPFTNPNMAAAFASTFEDKLSGLKNKGIIGQQRARVRTKANFM